LVGHQAGDHRLVNAADLVEQRAVRGRRERDAGREGNEGDHHVGQAAIGADQVRACEHRLGVERAAEAVRGALAVGVSLAAGLLLGTALVPPSRAGLVART
jgi:hypothetical protein